MIKNISKLYLARLYNQKINLQIDLNQLKKSRKDRMNNHNEYKKLRKEI